MLIKILLLVLGVLLGAITTAQTQKQRVQEMVYLGQVTMANGERAGILLPKYPIGIAVQSKSGSKVLTVGDVLQCTPSIEKTEYLRKVEDDNGFEVVVASQELVNCGPPTPGAEDRVYGIVGLQWRDQ